MNKYSNTGSHERSTEVSQGEQPGALSPAMTGVASPGLKTEQLKSSTATTWSFWKEMRTAVSATIAMALLLCGIYPLAVWGVAQLVFPYQANGSLIVQDGHVVGSALIGQGFKGDRYFHPRPSAAGSDGYDAAASSGSNLGPLSRKLIDQVKERADSYRRENGLPPGVQVPVDAVTASASGLDPHISVRNAELQAARVAKARGIPIEEVRKCIRQYTEGPQLGFLGEQGVNVLKLNLAIERVTSGE